MEMIGDGRSVKLVGKNLACMMMSVLIINFMLSDERPLNYTYEENNILKKRQIDGPDFVCTSFDNCGDHNFVGVTLEDLTFTEEQRAMCNNDETCLFDLVVTGDEGFANTTLEASEESTRVQDIISKN